MENFFINYFSNQSNTIYPENTNQKFKIILPHDSLFGSRDPQKKLLVGLKFISFNVNPEVASTHRSLALKSSLVLSGDRSDGNQARILYKFHLPQELDANQYNQYIERPSFFNTSREELQSVEFEFLAYNPTGRFESANEDLFKAPVPVHIQVEVKELSQDMQLDHINLLVSSADSHSLSLHPTNHAYAFTYEAPQIRIRDDEKWVMGLKSISLPSLVKNAYDPTQCWMKYHLKFTPKKGKLKEYLPYEEFYEGPLESEHFGEQLDVWADLNKQLKSVSLIDGIRVTYYGRNNQILSIMSHPHEYYVHKANLLKRPNPESGGLFREFAESSHETRGDDKKRKRKYGGEKRKLEAEDEQPRPEFPKPGTRYIGFGGGFPDDPDDPDDEETVFPIGIGLPNESDDDSDDADNVKDPPQKKRVDSSQIQADEPDQGDAKKRKLDTSPNQRLPDEDDFMMGDYMLAREILEADKDTTEVPTPEPAVDEYRFEEIDEYAKANNKNKSQIKHYRKLAFLKLTANHDISIYFEVSPLYARMLGIPMEARKYELAEDQMFDYDVKSYRLHYNDDAIFPTFGSPDTILLNCDVIEDTLVGDKKLPVLRHLYLGEKKFEKDKLQNWVFHIDHFQQIVVRSNPFRMKLYLTNLQGIPIELQEDQVNRPDLYNLAQIIMKRVE